MILTWKTYTHKILKLFLLCLQKKQLINVNNTPKNHLTTMTLADNKQSDDFTTLQIVLDNQTN